MAVHRKKAQKAVQKNTGAFKTSVHITAALTRPANFQDKSDSDTEYTMTKIYLDEHGSLLGEAYCGATAFICTKAEIPQIMDFLSSIVDSEKNVD